VVNDNNMEIVEGLIAYAESRGHSLLELSFARLLAEPAIASVIAGATSADQVRANSTAAGWQMSSEEIAAIDQIAPIP
jgi:aryl-alcohol dehydrogenase-like predicted oxidoreductase